jgi:hypothetical protein
MLPEISNSRRGANVMSMNKGGIEWLGVVETLGREEGRKGEIEQRWKVEGRGERKGLFGG